ncbi:metalloprotease family protein [Ureibacillus aquaedulcis]|uniref:Metalloprotease family protein n=1 Tax=Ureibacillus aquaedulcis TaxID=3058421 RepID=A0ABT8GRV0_9BACL|nr:metalloprotease family protein [Ureibacillus sp. BA0131]MDN4494142.1 metalloprotease family protein [Ureibacillus sp. BA0131]
MSHNVEVIRIDEKKVMKQTIILTSLLSILFVGLNYFLHPELSFSILRFLLGVAIYIIVSLLLVIANELLNIIGYRYRCKVARESISLSIHLEKGLIYSKTTEKIKNGHYQSIFLTSFAITGIIPLAFGFAIGNYAILLASASFIAGGLANFIGINKLQKFPDDCLVQDIPEEFSVYVYLNNSEKQAS